MTINLKSWVKWKDIFNEIGTKCLGIWDFIEFYTDFPAFLYLYLKEQF